MGDNLIIKLIMTYLSIYMYSIFPVVVEYEIGMICTSLILKFIITSFPIPFCVMEYVRCYVGSARRKINMDVVRLINSSTLHRSWNFGKVNSNSAPPLFSSTPRHYAQQQNNNNNNVAMIPVSMLNPEALDALRQLLYRWEREGKREEYAFPKNIYLWTSNFRGKLLFCVIDGKELLQFPGLRTSKNRIDELIYGIFHKHAWT